MKIKILESSGWYKNYVGLDFEITHYEYLGFRVNIKGLVYGRHCVITELPESFCVRKSDNKQKWDKYIDWFNKTYNADFAGTWDYYGLSKRGNWWYHDKPFGTEIHIDDMIKHIDYMGQHIKGGDEFNKQLTVKMESQKLSRQGLKEIHSIACSSWKITLEGWGSRNPLEDYIILSQKEIDMMFNASDNKQKSILSKYLKQDDESVDVKHCEISPNHIIDIRKSGEYEDKSFWISESYNWEIKKDSIGKLCLIPTKKK